MPDAPTPLDLDAIRVRADARRDYADERPESLHVPEDYAALADESAADVPALVEEVKRLRSESQRFYENRNLWQKRAEKAEAERDLARAEVDLLPGRSEATVKAEQYETYRHRIDVLNARLAAIGFPRCACHPAEDDSERCLPDPARWLAEVKAEALDEGAEAMEQHWAYGNDEPSNPYREGGAS